MKIYHHLNHYIIGGVALALGTSAFLAKNPNHDVIVQQPVSGHVETVKPSRFAWPSLDQDKTIALGENLTTLGPHKVTLFCANFDCQNLRTDIDDAFQIAGWNSSFEDQHVDSESDVGLFVGPAGRDAENLAGALEKALNVKVSIVAIDLPIGQLGVIFGKHPSLHLTPGGTSQIINIPDSESPFSDNVPAVGKIQNGQ